MIVFNVPAFFQAVIGVGSAALFFLVMHLLGFGEMLNETASLPFIALYLAVISAWLDLAGIKGKLFFLPTWIVCLAASIFLFHFTFDFNISSYDPETRDWTYTKTKMLRFAPLLYLFSVGLVAWYYKKWYKKMMTLWNDARQLLVHTKYRMDNKSINVPEFWQKASLIYFDPPFPFGLAYELVAKGSEAEFFEHSKEFVALLEEQNYPMEDHKKWMKGFKETLAQGVNLGYFDFQKLAQIIDHKNRNYTEAT